MSKRKFNGSYDNINDDKLPIVEKLYKESQESDYQGGGFCDDDDEIQEIRERISKNKQKRFDKFNSNVVQADQCIKCKQALLDSWLWDRFACPVCDGCRDDRGEHKLLPRTDVKSMYLLKDCDLDLRKPPLRYWSKKNPHNPRYGDMKLYLKCQVEERALLVHSSFEILEMKKEQREKSKEERSEKRFEKKLSNLRKQIRINSNTTPTLHNKTHEHQFGPEKLFKDELFIRSCKECGFEDVFEKL